MPATMPRRRGQILGDRALALGGLGHHEEAIAEAGQALELAPESAVLHHVLGFVLYFAGRPEDAIAPIQRALEIDPTFTAALRTLALAQAAIGKGDEAVELLQRALRQNPSDRDAILQLSLLHIETEQFADGPRSCWSPISSRRPTMCARSTTRAWRLRGLKRFEEARRALKRASRLSTDDPMVLTNLGCVLVDLGRAAEARSLHEHALRGLPGDSRLLGQLRHLPGRARREGQGARGARCCAGGQSQQRRALAARASSAHERGRRSTGGRAPAHRRRRRRPPGAIPPSVTLVAVSKTHGADRVRELLAAGQRVFGENRVQEAEEKFPALKAELPTSSCI